MLYRTAIWTGWNNAGGCSFFTKKEAEIPNKNAPALGKAGAFLFAGDGVLNATRADAGSRPYKLFLFCRLFFLGGCLRGRGLCGGGVQNGLLFGYGLVQLVHAGLGGIAGGKQVRVFAVGVQRRLGLFQCALASARSAFA